MRDSHQLRYGFGIPVVAPKRCNLTHLDLSMASYGSADICAEILLRCHSLKALSLEFGKLDRKGCIGIAQNGGLEILNLCMCHGLEETGLQGILNGCRK